MERNLRGETIHKPTEINEILDGINKSNTVKTNKKVSYYNFPISFDIEVSSFYNQDGEKSACMYTWMMDINGSIILGRFWIEFIETIREIEKLTKHNKRLIIWVHNLGYEFQFIRKFFEWEKVFSLSERTPVYALTKTGIEFRCSYILSGLSLEKTADEIKSNNVKKLVGNLDYKLVRTGFTPLTEQEIGYCINDVKILEYWIREKIESDGDITRIPLTKTGYVRNHCRNKCFYNDGKHRGVNKYQKLVKGLKMTVEEYQQLKRAFMGGFTHANPFHVGKTLENVRSFDFTSAYPYVMLTEKFPMSNAREVEVNSEEELDKYVNCYCCLFNVAFTGLESEYLFENPISSSKCYALENEIVANGRVVSADFLITTITEVDWWYIKKFYTWENVQFSEFRIYTRDYLPKEFIECVLDMYENKTILKGVEGKEEEYQVNKGMLNACYGMMVTDPCRKQVEYIDDLDEWSTEKDVNVDEAVEKYNNSKNRFISYPWGIWVTAYNRRNLFTAILEAENDYIYSDTDSIKLLNAENHKEYFDNYNKLVELKIHNICEQYGLNYNRFNPKDKKGQSHLIGIWDDEGMYSKFKTLGAKRYMYVSNNELILTVSGLNKKKAVKYLLDEFKNDIDKIFNFFNDEMEIPAGHSGRLTHTYKDKECEGEIEDYLGNIAPYQELSYIYMEESAFTLDMAPTFLQYLEGLYEIL